MHEQSFCFANCKLIAFLPFSLPSPSLLLKLLIVVIQKFCYHGNVTSHFSSLFRGPNYLKCSLSIRRFWLKRGKREAKEGESEKKLPPPVPHPKSPLP